MIKNYERLRKYSFAAAASGEPLGTGCPTSTTHAKIFIPFSCKMAAPPTGISISAASHFSIVDGSDVDPCVGISFISATKYGVYVDCDVTGSTLTMDSGSVLYANSASATFEVTGGEPDY